MINSTQEMMNLLLFISDIQVQGISRHTHNEVQFGFGVDDLIQFDDIGMLMFGQSSQDPHFLAVLL